MTAQCYAGWEYDTTHGGLVQYHTPTAQSVTLIRDGVGRHPTQITNAEADIRFAFQDNSSGLRAIKTISDSQGINTSHTVFGGLSPMAEFLPDGSM